MKYYFLALGTVVVVCVGCAMDGSQITNKGEYHAPPAEMMMRPGPMVDGPGPGVIPAMGGPGMGMGGPGMGGMPMMGGMAMQGPMVPSTSQVRFVGPDGMVIGWQIPGTFAENQLIAPARYNFVQGQAYRLKLTNIPGREALVIYPSLEVYPTHPNTDAYLTHNSLPLQITVEDLDQVESNNFVTKVIYLPDAKFQELAIANVETLVSTRLDPGVDPIQEADKMGTIMAVLRMGNMDLEMPSPVQMPGQPTVMLGPNGIQQTAYQVDGTEGRLMPPMPIGPAGAGRQGIPNAMIVAGGGLPGQPAGPIAGVNAPVWGMPYTGTPIGLPGPTHLPLGGPASLKSHTVVNRTKQNIPEPVEHMTIGVKHSPGISLPKPVSSVEYEETHPVYSPGELSYPAWARPQQ
ncbi:MAG: hypothetical protein SFV23_25965 [Planctomycetaceae bacterium]|nr:hypothetical protein [Planctomycetaceae bacterium]